MAIYNEVYTERITNAAAITKGSSWIGAYRFRMSYNNGVKYGPFNALIITNDSSQDATIQWDINNEGVQHSTILKAGDTFILNVEDGRRFYNFDVLDTDSGTDIAIGKINGIARVIRQEPE